MIEGPELGQKKRKQRKLTEEPENVIFIFISKLNREMKILLEFWQGSL